MGTKRGVVSSRHRVEDAQFYSAITYVNSDLLTFNQVYDVKVVDFEIMGGAFTGGFSNYNLLTFLDASKIRFTLFSANERRPRIEIGGLASSFTNIKYLNDGALLDVHRFVMSFNFGTGDITVDYYINNVIEASQTINNTNLMVATLQPDVIGFANVQSGVKSVKFTTTSDSVVDFKMNEGSGFTYTDVSSLFTMTGSTANPSGLTYWNSNVWTPL